MKFALGRLDRSIVGALVLASLLSFVLPIPAAHAQNSVVVARGVQTGLVVFGNAGGIEVNGVTSTVTLGTPSTPPGRSSTARSGRSAAARTRTRRVS